jgi:hypothetical protein
MLAAVAILTARSPMTTFDNADPRPPSVPAPEPTVGDMQQQDVAALIDLLGRDVPIGRKRAASRALIERGTSAIPALIAALGDQRTFERRDIANRMNLPPNAAQPAPLVATITVGDQARDLLYEIITPARGSRFGGSFKVFSEQKLQVDDWPRWWSANQRKSLAEIHAEMQPLIDAYWKEHGTTQRVDPAQGPDRWEQGLPVPRGARRNDALSGATTLGPGRNMTRSVYDTDAGLDALATFYETYLPDARRSTDGNGTVFATAAGKVTLVPTATGCRITLTTGPR